MLRLELLKRCDAAVVRVKLADDLSLDLVQRDTAARLVSGETLVEKLFEVFVRCHGVTLNSESLPVMVPAVEPTPMLVIAAFDVNAEESNC